MASPRSIRWSSADRRWAPPSPSAVRFAVWGLTVLFGLVDLLPGGVLLVMILSVGGAAVMEPTLDLAMVFQVGWVWVWTSVGLVVAQWLASAQAYAIHVVLRPHSELTDQVAQLTSSRSELVDLFETERRRIEERQAAFHRVRHLRTVAQRAQDVIGERGLVPEIERLVDAAPARHTRRHLPRAVRRVLRRAARTHGAAGGGA